MASITIRNLDDALESRLRDRAADHNRSIEDEARVILHDTLIGEAVEPSGFGTATNALFAPLGGLSLQPIEREPMREPPSFDA